MFTTIKRILLTGLRLSVFWTVTIVGSVFSTYGMIFRVLDKAIGRVADVVSFIIEKLLILIVEIIKGIIFVVKKIVKSIVPATEALIWLFMAVVAIVVSIIKAICSKIKKISLIKVKWPEGLATAIFVGISIFCYCVMSPYYGVLHLNHEWALSCSGIVWGLMSGFMHGNLSHIAYNLLLTIPCMLIIEKKMGPIHMAASYIFCAIMGTIIQTHFFPGIVGIGSSTATFGLVPLAVFLLTKGFSRLTIMAALTVICLESARFKSMDGVGHLAHVGGMIAGMLYVFAIMAERKIDFNSDKE